MEIHPQFRLNGHSFSKEALVEVAYSWIKEGLAHEASVGDFLMDWLDASPKLTVNTSGSTGAPKPITMAKSHMINSALATGKFFGLRPGQKALLCLSADFIAGKMMLVRAMVLGLHLDVEEPSSHPLRHSRSTYDFAAMVPLQLQHSLEGLKNIKQLIVGGAAVSPSLRERLQGVTTAVYETYGMTETITHIALKRISGEVETAFKVLPDIGIRKDERDCLVIDAPKITNQQVATNDVVEVLDNRHFVWLGRFDNIINSGGIKLVPEQLESSLSTLLENRFFLAGIPDEELGGKLILVVEGEVDVDTIESKIRAAKLLDRYALPKAIFNLPNFVETASGKINRNACLRELFNI